MLHVRRTQFTNHESQLSPPEPRALSADNSHVGSSYALFRTVHGDDVMTAVLTTDYCGSR